MADDWIFRLECGDRSVNLLKTDAGGWGIVEGGVIISSPAANVTYSGNSRYSGARRMGTTYQDIKISLQVHLTKQSGLGVLQKNIHDVMQFITEAQLFQEGKSRTPVYLVRRLAEGYSGTGNNVVLFGRGNIYHEVKTFDSIEIPESSYSKFLRNGTSTIQGVKFTLTVSPFGYSKTCFAGHATGWVRFDQDGAIDIYGAGSNMFTNGGFEHTTASTNWTRYSASLSWATERERVYSGFQALQISSGSNSELLRESMTLTNGSVYTISAYVYKDGGEITSTDCVLLGAASTLSTSTTFTADTKAGWYRLSASLTGDGTSKNSGLWAASARTLAVDGFQIEPSTYVTPLMLENSVVTPGVTYDGTVHASAQTRAAGVLRYGVLNSQQSGAETIFYGKGTVSVWVKTPWTGADDKNHYILDTGQTTTRERLSLYKDSSNNLVLVLYGSTTSGYKQWSYALNATIWPANTWLHIIATWDAAGTLALYLNGAAVGSGSSSGTFTALTQLGSSFFVGSNMSQGQQLDGTIADLRIFGPDATVTVADLYAAGRGKSMFPFVWTNTLGAILSKTVPFYIANVPGDFPARCRLYLSYEAVPPPGGGTAIVYFGLKNVKNLPFVLDIVYGASTFSASTGTITGSVHQDQNYLDRDYFSGRYNVWAWGTTTAGTGNYQMRATVDGVTDGYKSINQSGSIFDCNMGTFWFPAVTPAQTFFGGERVQGGEIPVTVDINNVGGSATVLAVTTIKLFAEEGGYLNSGCIASNDALVLDSIGIQGKAYQVSALSGSPSYFKSDATAVDWRGNIPTLDPRVWIFVNELDKDLVTGGGATVGTFTPLISYMAQWGWGT